MDTPAKDPATILADLLASFGKKPKGTPAPKGKKLPRNASPLPFDKAYAEKKTGYTTWVAKARVIMLEEQVCSCCGSRTTAVKDELFLLTHSVSHSAWLRHEGYGIEHSEDLPLQAHYLDPRTVTACAACFSSAASSIIEQLHHEQVQLHLPL